MALPSPFYYYLLPSLFYIIAGVVQPSANAQTYQNISLGSSLTPTGTSTSWLSSSGEFAFGFRPLDSNQTLFLLAIWFDKTTSKTTVWYANGDNPVQLGSRVDLTTNGQLSLKDQTATEIWSTGITDATFAAMLDTGNFVLMGSDGTARWQSFSVPTDTIVPGQNLAQGSKLRSKLTDDDFSGGRFMLNMQLNGNLVLYPVEVLTNNPYSVYWNSNTVGSEWQLVFNESGNVYLASKNSSQSSITSSGGIPKNDVYQRATLDPDGVFRQYVYNKNGTSWAVVDAVPKDICKVALTLTGSGACGFNSYCKSGDIGQRTDCECPPQYSFTDTRNKYKGCKPDFLPQSCDSSGSDFDFVALINVDWPYADYEMYQNINEAQCRQECLGDCFCAVAIYREDRLCWKKKYPLSNGQMGSYVDRKALIKVRKDNNSWSSAPDFTTFPRRDSKVWILTGSVLLGSSVFVNIILIIAVLAVIYCSSGMRRRKLQPTGSMTGVNLQAFTFKELEELTCGFREEVGRGAFGTVYKGFFEANQPRCVAVKKLDNFCQDLEDEFINEVQSIGQTCHKNLVKLLGYCNEGNERLLVYEYMSNGSLTNYLFNRERPQWNHRVQIAMGVAQGLFYLHEGLDTQIIHCDIKPENILLDDKFVAKISDFGLAKLLRKDKSRTNTGIRGTKGYVAPDWFKNVGINAKVDVYSFGVLLLEIICCRKNVLKEADDEEQLILTYWAYDCYKDGRVDLLVENDEEALFDLTRVDKFVTVAFWCIQDDPSVRPTMQKVMQMLEGSISIPVPPDPS